MTKRHIFVSLVSILFTLALTWFFFSQQIKTAFVYVTLGMRAPMSIRWQCMQTSRQNVEKKFSVPTKFDAKTIADLKLFWHYSFYTGCLSNAGFDHYGKPYPPSTLKDGIFTNSRGKFSLKLGEGSISSDNQVDVTYDDRLLVSRIQTKERTLEISFYKKFDGVETPTITEATCKTTLLEIPILLSGSDLSKSACEHILSTLKSL